MSKHENPLQNMLLQFQCVRKHFFFNKTYAIQINGQEILIGENLKSPKYRIPICMQTIITISNEPRQEGFIVNYHGQPKLFNLQVDKLIEFKNAISSKVLFGEMNQHYKYVKELGQGAYSEVRKLISLDDSKPYAGKIIKKNRLQDALNEIDILSALNHPNILKLHEVYDNSSTIVMIQEFIDGVTLEEYVISRCLPIKTSDLQRIMRQILLALCYLHEQKVIHRDIKPDNIMIDKQMNLKLIDLGLASRLGKQYIHPKCGTPGYVAPEVINGPCNYDCKSDIYSLGVTFYRLLTFHQIKEEVNLDLLQFLGLPDSAVDLLNKMLQQNPKNRINARDALQHQYFKELPKPSAKKILLTQSFTPSVMEKLTTEQSKINDEKEQDLQDKSNGFGTYSRKQSILVRQISNLQREHQEQQGSRLNSPSSKQPSLLGTPRIVPESHKSLNIIEQQERLTLQLSMKKSLQIGQKKQSRYQTETSWKKNQQL